MIKTPGDSCSESKRNHHTQSPYAQGDAPVAQQKSKVNLQTNQEQEEDQAKVGGKIEGGH
jgi:hypothetical protein